MKVLIGIIVVIILFISSIISEINKYSHKKHKCTLVIPGKIVNVLEEEDTIDDASHIKIYRPIVNYVYNGNEYTYYHNKAKSAYKQLPVGMSVTIRINPDNPEEAVLKI